MTDLTPLPQMFSALADPIRFAIVERLLSDGELPVAQLREGIAVSAPAVSRHLNVLADAGLVTRRAQGQQRLYAVRPEALAGISDWTMSHRAFWQGSLDRLETALYLERDSE
jgi:DNA-binding transcriptional ArsR family regulator